MPNEKVGYAGYPSAVVYATPGVGNKDNKDPVQHLLWGDWLVRTGRTEGAWVEVKARGVKGWMRKGSIQEERLLEITFVDIGQGDGALVSTPDDRHLIIDAGAGDNLFRFLRWRFGKFRKPFAFEAAIISHPDSDHYAGFAELFGEPNLKFGTIYHNGIVERKAASAAKTLGPVAKAGGVSYLTEVVRTPQEFAALVGDAAKIEGKTYPTMLKTALDSGRIGTIRSLAVEDGFLPGYGAGAELRIAVLGPVVERDAAGAPRLRWFGDVGKTKNGHSIVLKLQYREVRVLLGGDLNIPAEHHLLGHHTGLAAPPAEADTAAFVQAARAKFEVDVAKACHHGSADFTDLFLQAVNPAATVISSGDDEPHSHPRADALGTIGRNSRGERPLIFSTELARSAPENIKHPIILQQEVAVLRNTIRECTDPKKKEAAERKLDKLLTDVLDRSVAVFGAINLRTDGDRVVIAQKLERPKGKGSKWDLYRLERNAAGVLRYAPAGGDED